MNDGINEIRKNMRQSYELAHVFYFAKYFSNPVVIPFTSFL